MGYLFWEEGIATSTPGVFIDLCSDEDYWGSAVAPQYDSFGVNISHHISSKYAWAVHSGGVSAVPVPAGI